MLQRHSLKDVAPAPHQVRWCLLRGISSQCADCRLLSSSLRIQAAPTFPLHTSLPNTGEIFVIARSNAATSGSISVQMGIIVSFHKITKEPPGVSEDAKLARSGWGRCCRRSQPRGIESQANQY